MRKFIQQKLKEQKGLTLIELLAVIVILAIIAAIAIPAIGGIIENSRVGAMKSDNLNAISAAELYLIDNPTATEVTLSQLTNKTYTLTSGVITAETDTAGGNAVYMDDRGSLNSFTYTKIGKLVDSSAKAGNMKMDANDAIKSNFSSLANSSRSATDPIKVAKE